jgi:hypothetical protein
MIFRGKSTIGSLINSVSNFSPVWIAHAYHPNLLPISTIAAAIANTDAVTAVVLTTIATGTPAVAAIAVILTFAITIAAAAAVVTAVILIIVVTAAVAAHAQLVVRAKPPNRQTQSPVA